MAYKNLQAFIDALAKAGELQRISVPVDPYNLRDPKRDMIWISLAGPGANILAAFVLGRAMRLLAGIWLPDPLLFMLDLVSFPVFTFFRSNILSGLAETTSN
jgi:hypothetical protein